MVTLGFFGINGRFCRQSPYPNAFFFLFYYCLCPPTPNLCSRVSGLDMFLAEINTDDNFHFWILHYQIFGLMEGIVFVHINIVYRLPRLCFLQFLHQKFQYPAQYRTIWFSYWIKYDFPSLLVISSLIYSEDRILRLSSRKKRQMRLLPLGAFWHRVRF